MNKAVLSKGETTKNTSVKIFVFPKVKIRSSFLGKGKNIFGDGVEFQRKIRKEWQ